MPALRTALIDLLYETRDADLKLILGGGFGLFLKREILRERGTPTLFKEWPEIRSTNDLDLFLRPELLNNSAQLKPLALALEQLKFKVIAGAKKSQFARLGPLGDRQGSLKIDLLTSPPSRFSGTSVQIDSRRAKPKPSVNLHAHLVEEAITLEEGLQAIELDDVTSSGLRHRGELYLPHPFTYALMKLFAYRDRIANSAKEFGSYHALDLYSIIAMMTEAEWDEAMEILGRHRNHPLIQEARGIVQAQYATPISTGFLRIKESPYYRTELELDRFQINLRDLFSN